MCLYIFYFLHLCNLDISLDIYASLLLVANYFNINTCMFLSFRWNATFHDYSSHLAQDVEYSNYCLTAHRLLSVL